MNFEEWEKTHMGESLKGKTISEVAKAVHANAKAHGWWSGRDRNFGELIALCHSELSEAFEEYRDHHDFAETYYTPQPDGTSKMEGIPSELADVVIRVMDMCEHYGIDLEAAIAEKHAYNLTRPYRHGGKKA